MSDQNDRRGIYSPHSRHAARDWWSEVFTRPSARRRYDDREAKRIESTYEANLRRQRRIREVTGRVVSAIMWGVTGFVVLFVIIVLWGR